jgi:hypothetical protein
MFQLPSIVMLAIPKWPNVAIARASRKKAIGSVFFNTDFGAHQVQSDRSFQSGIAGLINLCLPPEPRASSISLVQFEFPVIKPLRRLGPTRRSFQPEHGKAIGDFLIFDLYGPDYHRAISWRSEVFIQ